MTIQTTTEETFEAQLRADDQDVLWLIDATDGRVREREGAVNDAAWWARVVEVRHGA